MVLCGAILAALARSELHTNVVSTRNFHVHQARRATHLAPCRCIPRLHVLAGAWSLRHPSHVRQLITFWYDRLAWSWRRKAPQLQRRLPFSRLYPYFVWASQCLLFQALAACKPLVPSGEDHLAYHATATMTTLEYRL